MSINTMNPSAGGRRPPRCGVVRSPPRVMVGVIPPVEPNVDSGFQWHITMEE